jgi:hypothetical protein
VKVCLFSELQTIQGSVTDLLWQGVGIGFASTEEALLADDAGLSGKGCKELAKLVRDDDG